MIDQFLLSLLVLGYPASHIHFRDRFPLGCKK